MKKNNNSINGFPLEERKENSEIQVLKKKVDAFIETLKLALNKKILIIIKGYPDPDNIAASFAFQYIASFLGIQSTILYFKDISHIENRVLVKKLSIEMIRYDENFPVEEYGYTVFNDTQTTYLPIQKLEVIPPLILIDHHKNLARQDAIYTDIREDAGSTCSIYVQYFMESKFLSGIIKTSHFGLIATALMYGIRTDTDNFIFAKNIDFISAAWLNYHVNQILLSYISNHFITSKNMDLIQKALENKDIKGSYLFTGIEFIKEQDRDNIAEIADYLIRREGIDTVIVYGIVGEKYVDASFRTKNPSLDPDKWIKELLGYDNFGNPYGGGRWDKGGFNLPLNVFSHCSDKKLLWNFVKTTLTNLFYGKLEIKSQNTL